jgi:hypothetical protein
VVIQPAASPSPTVVVQPAPVVVVGPQEPPPGPRKITRD